MFSVVTPVEVAKMSSTYIPIPVNTFMGQKKIMSITHNQTLVTEVHFIITVKIILF